jgi:hypothetical protein
MVEGWVACVLPLWIFGLSKLAPCVLYMIRLAENQVHRSSRNIFGILIFVPVFRPRSISFFRGQGTLT